ncbi:nucleotide sugar dehydrogenase [Protaetiibacter intestinalis]|uniref:Nucleotide sugar dehydrogenase n=1 Tax=Protaetiibacter intestinalis TaxID=2419774 RepID=A0A387BII4_9MICO|nr:nucleotide sugar dehydrogenase [Protaetiibacter intestinalis]AYF98340.1 nucleotide sugar dehydrogenase [Protaetiibacter intestinalis]
MNVVVVGAGKMGLPIACQLASRGATVVACDVNPAVVDLINEGRAPFEEPGLSELLAEGVLSGRLRATTDTAAAVAEADVVIVIVPALLTPERDIDSSMIEAVAKLIAPVLPADALVSFETTMPVGGTRARLIPLLESAGKVVGIDFEVVFSPERVKSGFLLRNLTVNPKVVGATSPEAATRASDFYHRYLGAPVQNVGTLEAAEFVKLAGMVYRDVNIALANELASYAEITGLDLQALLPMINSDGEAAMLQPGIGVGGHCTPVYPYFLIRDAERRGLSLPMTLLGRQINDSQAAHAVEMIEASLGSFAGKRVNILGLAFRPQVKETAFSTAFLLGAELRRRGAEVLLTDPMFTDEEIRGHGFRPASIDTRADALILNTAHPEFLEIDWGAIAGRGVSVVLDGRNGWRSTQVTDAGIRHLAIGTGSSTWA